MQPGDNNQYGWGSDKIAETVRALDLKYLALVPGSSFRGLHDSLVNHLGNENPQLVMCLHEGNAVLIAEGYARVTNEPMAVALHANVGLMHGTMAIFNAWCDRYPMIIFGGTGPMDAHKRRPWIDWVHTAKDQASMIRNFIKWDDQPGSVEAAVESVLRANQITRTEPNGPVYVCLDASIQEEKLSREVIVPQVSRYAPAASPAAPAETVKKVVDLLNAAKNPLILFGRGRRSQAAWDNRVALAEVSGATVMSGMHCASAFPTEHASHVYPPIGEKPNAQETEILAGADLILSFDWHDLSGFLAARSGASQTQTPVEATVISCSLDAYLSNGWTMDHQALAAVDVPVLASPEVFAGQLIDAIRSEHGSLASKVPAIAHWTAKANELAATIRSEKLRVFDMSFIIAEFTKGRDVTFPRLPFGWSRFASRFATPLDFLGKDGGGTVGSGPGHCVGAALALKDSGRLIVGIVGDGDFAMGGNALWTASHMSLPLIMIVANNHSYFNDEVHQERVARQRERPVENKWIGQRIEPAVDNIAFARSQGFEGIGPVRTADELRAALVEAERIFKSGGRVVIDVEVEGGYGDE